MNEFEVGEVVIYKYSTFFELCIIKEVIPIIKRRALKQDGLYGTPTGEEYTDYMYRVFNYTSDITRLTDGISLYKISNKDAFTIKKKRKIKKENENGN